MTERGLSLDNKSFVVVDTGIRETKNLLSISVEAEKEIVLPVVSQDISEKVLQDAVAKNRRPGYNT